MAEKISTIAFDADDTLWHNERFFQLTQQRFADLLKDYAAPDHLDERLLAAERRNLGRYGFGIKGFMLSMIETAVEITGERVPGSVISQIIAAGQEMLVHPVELLPHAREAVEDSAARGYRVMLITKGDLLDQERKLAGSGLGELFDAVEIVSDKTATVYAELFSRHADGAARALMVGNSMKSDVLPVIAAGGWGVHVPHEVTWALEHADHPTQGDRFRELPDLGQLSAVLDEIAHV
ncbi:HAD family hydrolase [Pseudooceanicola sp. CBS1P-1]|uniref:HAD family hydrolase n=1 Tax=Pseudooceanicola albus TaxID=2692189 RepID=A0A6L7G923_9RHOB|nr:MULTISPECIES: HAD family hydrolase [Pseudooceanicola]MBT9386373.1 HAD family hydrolase [Pseudooceanicola endophyticus]MXN20469.1 HAD family hydrolase [Pseudooceanicola albus]